MIAVTETKPPISPLMPASHGLGYKIGWFFLNNGIIIALFAEVLIFTLVGKSKFWNSSVLAIILQTTAAVGMLMPFYTLSMISGIVDFGGAPMGAVMFAVLITGYHWPWPVALLGSLALSFIIGSFNSWLVLKVRIPAIVTTLMTGGVLGGVAYMLSEHFGRSYQIKLIVPALRHLWLTKPLGLPLPVYFMFVLYIFVYVLLNHTRVGAHLYAIGANPDAAQRAGINYYKLFIIVFVLLNSMTSIAIILHSVRVMNAGPYISPNISSGAGVPVTLAAALFAGIGLFGGSGRVEFTLVGLLFFAVLMVGMAVITFPAQFRVAVDGIAFLAALLLDSIRRYLSTR